MTPESAELALNLDRCCHILTHLEANDFPEAEQLLSVVLQAMAEIPRDEMPALLPLIATCTSLARNANELWERRKATVSASEPGGYGSHAEQPTAWNSSFSPLIG